MSVGPPRWTWRSMSSTACWNSDARTMSASPNLDGAGVNAPAPLIRATQPRELQGLADELGIEIAVHHLPPGTSKWNKIEHRLFSFISMNWKGKTAVRLC